MKDPGRVGCYHGICIQLAADAQLVSEESFVASEAEKHTGIASPPATGMLSPSFSQTVYRNL